MMRERHQIETDIAAIIVMGVSGSGKSTVGCALAQRLDFVFEDADSFHSKANVEKLRAGIPLTNEDRWPWLRAVATNISAHIQKGQGVVVACSALHKSYRDLLRQGGSTIRLIYLRGSRTVLAKRLDSRRGHFMNPSLLDSQLDDLEEPIASENSVTIDVDQSAPAIVDEIVQKLQV